MMEKCFDEGTLQAFLDNELAPELSQAIARHLVDCDPCAILLSEVEEETAFAFAALEQEFNTLVPTQRLWTKINESIEVQHRKRSFWQHILTFVSSIRLSNPHVVAFGSLLLIVGVVSTLIVIKNDSQTHIAKINDKSVPPVQTAQTENRGTIIAPPVVETPVDTPADTVPSKVDSSINKTTPQYRVERANYVETNQRPVVKPSHGSGTATVITPAAPQYVDGEESYVDTIARLEKTVNQNKDQVLKPAARFSYEKDLAVVNDTISKLRKEVKKNPKNEDAKQILFASYQNKIELLNSVTQRGELMASLR